jgi:hypothetical protein
MAVTINIGNIEAVHIASPIDDIAAQLLEQISAGTDPEALRDIGYQGVPDEGVASHMAEEAQLDQAAIDATSRRNFLRNVVGHADKARGMEGFQTNHQRRPDRPKQVNSKEHTELKLAEESLQRACAVCALSKTCTLRDSIDTWLDFHPYKSGPKGQRRPGSLLLPTQTESRTRLLRALIKDPLAHCDPSKRSASPAK